MILNVSLILTGMLYFLGIDRKKKRIWKKQVKNLTATRLRVRLNGKSRSNHARVAWLALVGRLQCCWPRVSATVSRGLPRNARISRRLRCIMLIVRVAKRFSPYPTVSTAWFDRLKNLGNTLRLPVREFRRSFDFGNERYTYQRGLTRIW